MDRYPKDRIQLAMYHASRGDMDTAWEAMLDPARLSPLQQISAQEQLASAAFGDDAVDTGIVGTLKRIVTNPVVWFGVALGSVFPFGRKAVQRFAQEAATYERTMGPISKFMAPGIEALRDSSGRMTRLGKRLRAVEAEIETGREEMYAIIGKAFRRFERLTGGSLAPANAVRIQMALEQPWNPKSPAYRQWDRLRKLTGTRIGVRPISLTGEERIIFGALDEARRLMKTTVLDAVNNDESLIRSLRSSGIIDVDAIRSVPVEFYAPRMLHVSAARSRDEVMTALRQGRLEDAVALANPTSPARVTDYKRYLASGVLDSLPKNLQRRTYELLPSPEHLTLIEKNLVPGTVAEVQKILSSAYPVPDANKMWGEFSLDVTRTFPQYLDSMLRFKAWTLSGAGQFVREELKTVEKQNKWLAGYTAEVLVPTLRGQMTRDEFMRAQLWEGRKMQWLKTLATNKFFQAPSTKKVAEWLTDSLVGNGRLSSKGGVDAAVSSYLYMSTLGGNLGSAFVNLMQTVTTTVPYVGPKAALEGVWKALRRTADYGRMRLSGVDVDAAYMRAFKPYVDAGLHMSADFGDVAFRRMVEESWQQASRYPKLKTAIERGKWALMLPFRAAESFNRMVAFEAGRTFGASRGLGAAEATKFAREMVEETQFLGGALMRPMGLDKFSRPYTMFAQFPLRFGSQVNLAVQRGEAGRLGTLLAGSAIAKEIGQAFGLDITRGMVASGLPLPEENTGRNLFGALPIVPPLLQLQGGALYGATTGDWQYARRALPLLVPGGIGLGRAAAMLHPSVASLLDKKYADYEHPTADGLIPMYKSNGQLVGQFTPLQITMLAMGLQPGDVSAEVQFTSYLQKQRNVTQAVRRAYVESWSKNDTAGMSRANNEYRKLYGRDIQLKRTDIEAMQTRRNVSRMELLLKQMPVELRPQFQEMTRAAAVERLGGAIGQRQPEPQEF